MRPILPKPCLMYGYAYVWGSMWIFLGSGRSQEVNPGRTRESREKRGHHDVPAGSEECPDSGRYPTPAKVRRVRRRVHQPPRYHQSPEIRCPFHNRWGNFPKNICKIYKRIKAGLHTSQMQTTLKSPYFLFSNYQPLFPV